MQKIEEDTKAEFENIILDLTSNSVVQQMKVYKQHYDTSCYEHCFNVAYYSYLICKKFNLDYKSVARSGMLHDLFLYDWRTRIEDRKGLHAFTHPRTALDNAKELFELSEKEEDIILKHMWPVTIKFPKYKESYIVTIVDKFCAMQESYKYYRKASGTQKILRYASFAINIMILNSFNIW